MKTPVFTELQVTLAESNIQTHVAGTTNSVLGREQEESKKGTKGVVNNGTRTHNLSVHSRALFLDAMFTFKKEIPLGIEPRFQASKAYVIPTTLWDQNSLNSFMTKFLRCINSGTSKKLTPCWELNPGNLRERQICYRLHHRV